MYQAVKRQVWSVYRPSEASPWNVRRVVHLHRRAGFAATWSEIQRDLRDGPEAAVTRLLRGQPRIDGVFDDFEAMAQTIGDAAVAANNPNRLKAWWVYRMLFTPDPLAERLALMWHNHFATSILKVDDVALMRQQYETFRQYGRASFTELLPRVIKGPAMLLWLDAQANRKAHPNENLAREIMELFTLGVGNYTEDDIKEAARSLTGWTVVRGEFREVDPYHDDGTKTILGHAGTFKGDDLIGILLKHPATARRLAWRICDTFLGEQTADDAALDELAEGLRENNLDIGWAVETVLRSSLFFSGKNMESHVNDPVDFVVGAARALEIFDPPPSTLLLAEQMAHLGQNLFEPPNVFGWDGGRAWINTRSLIGRGNFATALVEGKLHNPAAPFDAAGLARRHARAGNQKGTLPFFTRLLLGRDPTAALSDAIDELCADVAKSKEDAACLVVSGLLALPEAQLA